MVDCRTNRTPIERLGSIGFDWFLVRFRSISSAGTKWKTEFASLPKLFELVFKSFKKVGNKTEAEEAEPLPSQIDNQ